jgi:hypothetical protein
MALAQTTPTVPTLEVGGKSIVHTVTPGETLWGIAARLLDDAKKWNILQSENKIKDPNLILPGTQIVVVRKAAEPPHPTPTTSVAEVLEFSGPVWLKRGTEPQVKVERGMRVTAGDILATERGAFLSLSLPDGSKVVLPSASGMQILDVSERLIRIKLLEGRVESYVEKMRANNIRQFELQMRSANLGVRGTHFRGRIEDGQESAEVISGVVVAQSQLPGDEGKAGVEVNKAEGVVVGGATSWQKQVLLPAPHLSNPAFGWQKPAVNADPVRVLGLQPLAGAKGYRVQLARDEAFLRIFWETRTGGQNVVLPRVEGGFAYARVTAFDEKGLEGVPGDTLVFLPDNRETPRASLTPLGAGQYALRWPGYAGQSFDVSLGRDPQFSFKLVDETAVFGSGIVFGPLTVPGKYYWAVRVRDSSKVGPAFNGPQKLYQGEFEVLP